MATLNYRDPTSGAWVAMPVYEGPAGPAGPAGPTGTVAISGATGNTAATGSDGQLFVSATGGLAPTVAAALYVDVPGDAMTGELLVPDQVAVNPTNPLTAAARGYVDQVVTVAATGPTLPPVREGQAWFVVTDVVAPLPPTPVTGRYLRYIENVVTWTDTPDPTVTGYEVFYNLTGAPVADTDASLGTVLPAVQRIIHPKDDEPAQTAGTVYYGVRAIGPGGASDFTQAEVVRPESFSMWDLYGQTYISNMLLGWPNPLPDTANARWEGKDIVIDFPDPPLNFQLGFVNFSYECDPALPGDLPSSPHPWEGRSLVGATGLWQEWNIEIVPSGTWAGAGEYVFINNTWYSNTDPYIESHGYFSSYADTDIAIVSSPWFFGTWAELGIEDPALGDPTNGIPYTVPTPGLWSLSAAFVGAGVPAMQIRIKTEQCRYAWEYIAQDTFSVAQESVPGNIEVPRRALDPSLVEKARNAILERGGGEKDRLDPAHKALLHSLDRLTTQGKE